MNITNKLLLNEQFTWRTVRAMHELRHQGQTRLSVLSGNDYVQGLLDRRLLRLKPGRGQVLLKDSGPGFDQEYDQLLAAVHDEARQFLKDHQLLTPYLNYTLRQIQGLAGVYANAVVITRDELSRRAISSRHMGGSKVLKAHPALFRDTLRLLGLDELATADHILQTAVYTTGQLRANIIVLCENENYLKQPQKAKKLGVELQNAGGANTAKLEEFFVPPPEVSLYYACDWDFDGLKIFRAIAAGYRRQNRTIRLLTPLDTAERKPVDSPDHFSQWDARLWADALEPDAPADAAFTPPQRALIQQLVASNTWIEEESSEFTAVLLANGVAST